MPNPTAHRQSIPSEVAAGELKLESPFARWRALLSQELQRPIVFPPAGTNDISNSKRADGEICIRNIHHLLVDNAPPLELLRLTKSYAKACLGDVVADSNRRLVFRVMYLGAIASALTRLHQRISSLPNADLLEQFEWCSALPALPVDLRRLFCDALIHVQQASISQEQSK